jgi:protein TonB
MAAMNTSLGRFLGLSLALHALALLLLYFPLRPALAPRPENIPVSLLPIPEKTRPTAKAAPRTAPTRLSRTPAIIAKKNSPNLYEKTGKAPRRSAAREDNRAPAPPPSARAVAPEPDVIAERPLPSLKDLLPSATWSSSNAHDSSPVSLNTRDPVYVDYFTRIKQLIDSQWEYPELALRYGLQGTLTLEFTIGGNGRLEQLRLVRSSGSQLLDEEALRAIKAAAPFPPIPPWIKPNPLSIAASMEYHDDRLNYRFGR